MKYDLNGVSDFKLFGFVTGNYNCKCLKCRKDFIGDKRAVQCLECAINQAESKENDVYENPELKIQDILLNKFLKYIKSNDYLFSSNEKIYVNDIIKSAFKNIDRDKLLLRITENLEKILAEKLVNKMVTELGTDTKRLFENATIRDDFRFTLRKVTEEFLNKIKE